MSQFLSASEVVEALAFANELRDLLGFIVDVGAELCAPPEVSFFATYTLAMHVIGCEACLERIEHGR